MADDKESGKGIREKGIKKVGTRNRRAGKGE